MTCLGIPRYISRMSDEKMRYNKNEFLSRRESLTTGAGAAETEVQTEVRFISARKSRTIDAVSKTRARGYTCLADAFSSAFFLRESWTLAWYFFSFPAFPTKRQVPRDHRGT